MSRDDSVTNVLPFHARHFDISTELFPLIRNGSELTYCKFKKFRENFIFNDVFKRHVCYVKNVQLMHDLPTTVELFLHFERMQSFVKINPLQNFLKLQY